MTLTKTEGADVLEQVIIKGDLAQLKPEERVQYYRTVCESVGLNELTQPFAYIRLNNKLTLYALKGATDQLRKIYSVSIDAPKIDYMDDLIIVSVIARDKTGRTDADTGAVTIAGLKGDNKANAIMKAITKAKRRVTLSMCGLGMLDETELETIPNLTAYVAEELGAEVDGEGNVIQAETVEPETAPKTPEPVARTETPPEPENTVEVAPVAAETPAEEPLEDKQPETITEKRAEGLRAELVKLGYDVSNEAQVIETAFGLSDLEHLTDLTDGEAVILWQRLKRKAAEAAKPVWEKWQSDEDARTYAAKSETFSSGQELMGSWEEVKAQVGKENDGDLSNLYRTWFEFVNARVELDKKAA